MPATPATCAASPVTVAAAVPARGPHDSHGLPEGAPRARWPRRDEDGGAPGSRIRDLLTPRGVADSSVLHAAQVELRRPIRGGIDPAIRGSRSRQGGPAAEEMQEGEVG